MTKKLAINDTRLKWAKTAMNLKRSNKKVFWRKLISRASILICLQLGCLLTNGMRKRERESEGPQGLLERTQFAPCWSNFQCQQSRAAASCSGSKRPHLHDSQWENNNDGKKKPREKNLQTQILGKKATKNVFTICAKNCFVVSANAKQWNWVVLSEIGSNFCRLYTSSRWQ